MKAVLLSPRSGSITVEDVPSPVVEPGFVLIRNDWSSSATPRRWPSWCSAESWSRGNAETLLGDERRSATSRLGVWLCVDGLVHALASDGHRAKSWRPVTRLREAVEAAAALVGPERARWMAADAPAAIIKDEELPRAPPALARPRKRRLWGRR